MAKILSIHPATIPWQLHLDGTAALQWVNIFLMGQHFPDWFIVGISQIILVLMVYINRCFIGCHYMCM